MKPSKNLWFAAALVVTASLGFIAGKRTGGDPSDSSQSDLKLSDRDKSNARSSSRYGSSSSNRGRTDGKRGRNIDHTMKSLIALMERSPLQSMDFDGMFEVWEVIRSFTEDDVRSALTSVGDIKNPQLRMTMQMMLMNRWGKLNGEAAIEHAMKSENQQMKMMGTMGVFMSWTKDSPETAFDWYEKNQEKMKNGGGMYGGIYEGMVFQALARHDLTRALDQVDKLEGQQQSTALSAIGQAVADDPAKLKNFLDYLNKGDNADSKKMVMQTIVSTMAMQNPEQAKAFVESIDDPDEKKELTTNLLQSWSYMDPKGAIEWGMEQSENDADRKKLITSRLSSWAAQDAAAAEKWYASQPTHLKSDTAVSSTATTLGHMKQYKKALTWAERVEDHDTQQETRKTIYETWYSNSPTKAKAWAEGEGKDAMQGIDLDAIEAESTVGGAAAKRARRLLEESRSNEDE